MNLKPFYYIRHGKTNWNAEGRLQGKEDIPLNDCGIKQAEKIQPIINTLPISAIFYSPLKRATQTVDIACKDLTCPKIALDDLQARYWGSLEGTKEPQALLRAQEPGYDGELTEHYQARILKALEYAWLFEGTPLIVSHASMFHMLSALWQIKGYEIKNCDVLLFTPPKDKQQEWSISSLCSS